MIEQRDHDFARHRAKESDEILVFLIHKATVCGACSQAIDDGDMLTIRQDKGLCMKCAGLDELEFLPSGEAALTRRASKLSSERAIVLRWARARKRYGRQGTLVEAKAIVEARVQCAADAVKREAKNAKAAVKREAEDVAYKAAFLEELKRLFPGCPEQEAGEIAMHACEKHSGRVGRSASAKELNPEMIRLAVIAHIRHVHTGYDQFFDMNVRKHDARRMVQGKIERVLASWESSARP